MSQLVFKFPFKTRYYEQDYYVSSNNFSAYRLIESWPKWPDKLVNIFGPKGCGKTHLSNILKKKIKSIKIIKAENISNNLVDEIANYECLIIDDYQKNIEENLFYSLLNQLKQLNIFLVVNSITSIKKEKYTLKDLKSRTESFVDLGIELPSDDLLMVIISKFFSDKQVEVPPKFLNI